METSYESKKFVVEGKLVINRVLRGALCSITN